MALRKTDRTFAPNKKEIRYLNKTFPEFRQSLVDFAKVYYPDSYNDFNEASPGMMFIEMASYVGDVLSYYIDSQFRESLIQYAQEQDNVISIAQALGYRPKPSTAATTNLDVYQICPATDLTQNYAPDSRFLLQLDANMVITAPQFNVQFRTDQILDFSDPTNRQVTVYSTDGLGKPLTYLIKKTLPVRAGTIKTFQQQFGSAQRFAVITLPDTNVLEILSVADTNGNSWYEVDYLTQDVINDDTRNTSPSIANQSIPPFYILKLKRVSRRFVTRFNSNFYLECHFGSGVLDDGDIAINLQPNQVASSEYQTNQSSTPLDPADFLSSNSYGLAPSNTILTFTYAVGGGVASNVPSNAITRIDTVNVLNDTTGLSSTEQTLFADIKSSLAANNAFSATGGKDADSIEEIRQNAMGFFNAQNRTVTADDYTIRTYAMPEKYGGIAKAFVARDEQINDIMRATQGQAPSGGTLAIDQASPNIINLYILGYDQNGKLTNLNTQTKQNLKTYLDNYKILTDVVQIVDAFIVNIGVKFNVVVYKSYNMNEVLARCISAVQNFFDITKWDINQPIILNDLMLELGQVDGVQTVTSLQVFNRYAFQDGLDYENFLYDINGATENGIVYPSLDPAIFELRYPERDIIASATQ